MPPQSTETKRLGKLTCLPLRVVCFVAVFVLADNAALGDAAAVELTGIGAGEEDETGGAMAGWSEMGDSVDLRRLSPRVH